MLDKQHHPNKHQCFCAACVASMFKTSWQVNFLASAEPEELMLVATALGAVAYTDPRECCISILNTLRAHKPVAALFI